MHLRQFALHQCNIDTMQRCVKHIRLQSIVGYAGRSNNQYLLVGLPRWELVFLSISFGRLFDVVIST